MKTATKAAIIILPAAIALSSCNWVGKKGSGHITTHERQVSSFNKILVEGVLPVELSQTGDVPSVKVETDDNLQHLVTVLTEDDKLIVRTAEKPAISRSSRLKVYINVKDLRDLQFNSVGNLSTNGVLKLDSLQLESESVGKLDLDIVAGYLHADLNSVGSTTFTGKVSQVRINNKSVGKLSAFDLIAGTLMIHNTAVGVAEVYADSAFYIRSSAVGNLYYKGPGEVKEMKSDNIGRVQKKD